MIAFRRTIFRRKINEQGRQSNQVNQCICTTTYSARPENSKQKAPVQGKNNLSKLGSWEQLSCKPRNAFPRPILTCHFLIPIGALDYSGSGNALLSQNQIILQ